MPFSQNVTTEVLILMESLRLEVKQLPLDLLARRDAAS